MTNKRRDMTVVKRMHERGRSDDEIAKAFEVSVYTVQTWLREAGLRPSRKKNRDDAWPLFLKMWQAGENLNEIAVACDVSVTTIYKWGRESGMARGEIKAAKRAPAAEESGPPDNMALLLQTKGKWAELSDLARRWGVTHGEVQRRFHQARAGR